MTKDVDMVNQPPHYKAHPSGVECIQITEHMNFNLGNALKYLFRHKLKNGVEDLKKCVWYINNEVSRMSNEDWRQFPLDTRYEVSTQGRVRMKNKEARKLVKLKSGYYTFLVSNEGNYTLYYAHRAVAQTFIGSIPKGMCVCHANGCKDDNSLHNLYIGTVKDNSKDRIPEEIFSKFNSYNKDWEKEVFSLIWRTSHKNGLEDLKKARWYLDREIARIETYEQ